MNINQPNIFPIAVGLTFLLIILTVFVIFLAIAFFRKANENRQLYEQILATNKGLEQLVDARTKELRLAGPQYQNPSIMPAGFNAICCHPSISWKIIWVRLLSSGSPKMLSVVISLVWPDWHPACHGRHGLHWSWCSRRIYDPHCPFCFRADSIQSKYSGRDGRV